MTPAIVRTIATLATAGIVVLGSLAFTAEPDITARCADGQTELDVQLDRYPLTGNRVVVRDGAERLEDSEFGAKFAKLWSLPGHRKHTFTVRVDSPDDALDIDREFQMDECGDGPLISTTASTLTLVPIRPSAQPPVVSDAPSGATASREVSETDDLGLLERVSLTGFGLMALVVLIALFRRRHNGGSQ